MPRLPPTLCGFCSRALPAAPKQLHIFPLLTSRLVCSDSEFSKLCSCGLIKYVHLNSNVSRARNCNARLSPSASTCHGEHARARLHELYVTSKIQLYFLIFCVYHLNDRTCRRCLSRCWLPAGRSVTTPIVQGSSRTTFWPAHTRAKIPRRW